MNKEDLKEAENLESGSQEEEQGAETPSSEGVDYKSELEKVSKTLQKKEKQVKQAEHVIEKLKSKGGGEPDVATIEKIIDERMESFTQAVRGDAINNLVHSYSSNDDEAELIKYHLKHSIRASGDDEADILNAKALANKTKIIQQDAEKKRAEMRSAPEKASTAGAKDQGDQPLNISKSDQNIAKAFGLTREELEKGYQR